MIFELYPAILDEHGLVPALHWYAENFFKRTGINLIVNAQVSCADLTATQRIYLFRTIKELLNNAWKHGQAKEVIITIVQRPHHCRFIVDDDGSGFAADTYFKSSPIIKGIGLLTIRDWINNLHGSFSIESEPGQGARVIIDIPPALEETKK
jgi:signal transduction histidine kinase